MSDVLTHKIQPRAGQDARREIPRLETSELNSSKHGWVKEVGQRMARISKEYQKIIENLDTIRETATDIHGELIEALLEAGDIIADYEAAVAQTSELIRKYETPEPAINRGMDYYQCPECQKRTSEGHSHCHWCGKALEWTGRRRKR